MNLEKEFKEFVVTDDDYEPEKNFVACLYGPPTTYFFKCEKCGHEWKSFMTLKKTCPKCGTKCSNFRTDDF